MAQGTYSFLKLLGQANCNIPITTKKFYSKNGLCSQTIFLNSDFTYTSESGCEERSYVIMGRWKLKGDSVELSAYDTVKVPMICSIRGGRVPNKSNKRTTFIIKDKTGKPVENFLILPHGKGTKYIYTDEGITENPFAEEIPFNSFETDKNGRIDVDHSLFDSLAFSKLASIMRRTVAFSTKNLPAVITIRLNLNKEVFYYPVVRYFSPSAKVIRYKLSRSSLKNSNSTLLLEK
jgi:hypothetical protein